MKDNYLSRRGCLRALAGVGVVRTRPSVGGPVRPLVHDEIGDMLDGSPFPTKVFVVVQIVDECTGEPVEDATIYPHWKVEGSTNAQSHIAPTSTVTQRAGLHVVTLTSETHHRGGKIQVPTAVTEGRALACGKSIPLSDGVLEQRLSLTDMIETLVGKPDSLAGALKTALEAAVGASAPVKLSTGFPTYWAVITASVRCDCPEPTVDDGIGRGSDGRDGRGEDGAGGSDGGGRDGSGGSVEDGRDEGGRDDGNTGDGGDDGSVSDGGRDETGGESAGSDEGAGEGDGGPTDDGGSDAQAPCADECDDLREQLETARENLQRNREKQERKQAELDERQGEIQRLLRKNKVRIYQNTASGEVVTGTGGTNPEPPLEYKGWMMDDDAARRLDRLERSVEGLRGEIERLKERAAALRDRIERLDERLRRCLERCEGSDPGSFRDPQPPVPFELATLPGLGQATAIAERRQWDELGFDTSGSTGSGVKDWAEAQSGYLFADAGEGDYEPPEISVEDVMTGLFDGDRGDPVALPRAIPAPFATEQVNLYVGEAGGPTEVLGFDLRGDRLAIEAGGVDDPTMFVSTDRDTFFEIVYSPDPAGTAERARKNGRLSIGGVGTRNEVAWTLARAVVDVGGFVGGLGRSIGGYL